MRFILWILAMTIRSSDSAITTLNILFKKLNIPLEAEARRDGIAIGKVVVSFEFAKDLISSKSEKLFREKIHFLQMVK